MDRFVVRPRYNDSQGAKPRGSSEISAQVQEGHVPLNIVGPAKKESTSRSIFVEAPGNTPIERMRDSIGPDLVVEEVIEFSKMVDSPHDLLRSAPLDLSSALKVVALDNAGRDRSLTVNVKGRRRSHVPLLGAEVYLFLAAGPTHRDRMVGRTNEEGNVTFEFSAVYSVLAVIIVPYSEYWSKTIRGVTARKLSVVCDRLPESPTAWWHEAVQLAPSDDEQGIRVGVIDSGCGPHPALEHVRDRGAFIDGEYLEDGSDSGSHGTHVSGIIGARATGTGIGFWGGSPGVELFSVRVFPAHGRANQADIADAIDLLVEDHRVDIINMSLGGGRESIILEQAIENAFRKGVVCVCAAGNDSGPISYPAAYEKTLSIAAIGKLGFVPADSSPALPTDPSLFGEFPYHAANFTNHGPGNSAIAPGVGIISAVPSRFGYDSPYVAMNGTSMASPLASATLAAMLSEDASYAGMARGSERSRYARMRLAAASRSIGLPREYEGAGLPRFR